MDDSRGPAASPPPGPAEHLARLRRQYPAWTLRHVSEGWGFEATRPDMPNIWAMTLDDLEAALHTAEHGDGDR